MRDSLNRIKTQPKEVWAVKLADRITNLQKPPSSWDKQKIRKYYAEAEIIYQTLKQGNDYLARRLEKELQIYEQYSRD